MDSVTTVATVPAIDRTRRCTAATVVTVSATAVTEVMDATASAAHVYTVTAVNPGASTLTINPGGTIGAADVFDEAVVVAVRDAAQPPLQTIRYRFGDSDGNGTPGWEDWYDDETGEDDPCAYVSANAQAQPTT